VDVEVTRLFVLFIFSTYLSWHNFFRISKGQIHDDEGIDHYCSVECMARSKTFDTQLSDESIYHRNYKKASEKEGVSRSGTKPRGRGSAIGHAVRGGVISHTSKKEGMAGEAFLLGPVRERQVLGLDVSAREAANERTASEAAMNSSTNTNNNSVIPSSVNIEKNCFMTRPVRERVVNGMGSKPVSSPKGTNILPATNYGIEKGPLREEEGMEFDDDLPPLEDLSLLAEDDEDEDGDLLAAMLLASEVVRTLLVCSFLSDNFLLVDCDSGIRFSL
jgi:hypothetical protein